MTDEELVRWALHTSATSRAEHYAALDRLVAERDANERDIGALSTRVEELLARAEAAEKERDEALDSVVLYVNERDEAVRLYGMEANERRSAEARANNHAPYVKRSQAAEARCATLEAALRAARHELDQWVLADNREMAYRVERAEAIIDAALAAATPPAEEEGT